MSQQLSQAAYDRLRSEHEDLTTRGRVEIARKIEAARELGDLSENGDYHAAKEEQGKMEGRILHLAAILEDAVIVEAEAGGKVVPGSVVTLSMDGEEETYLLGSIEERHDDLEVMSPGSPLGELLVGREAGYAFTYTTPTGYEMPVEILAVE
jgi:transcription elongation factor GreA